MSRRTSILERLRRWKNGAARQVVAAFALAYLCAGVAPCATAAVQSASDSLETVSAGNAGAQTAHAHHAEHAPAAHEHHGTAAHGDHAPAPSDHGDRHCPHCPAGAAMQQAEAYSSCFALEDLTSVAASQAKAAAQALAPSLAPAAFTLPPPLASPAPPLRAAAFPVVPLNVRLCVFLI